MPDERTVCKFRYLLERHDLVARIFKCADAPLQRKGTLISTGTIVNVTLASLPNSTKNARGAQDPETRQSCKGKQW